LVNRTITPTVLRSFYNINGISIANATQQVFATLTQHYSPADLLKHHRLYGLVETAKQVNIGNHSNDQVCINSLNDCIEGNLDIQYLMGTSQGSTTTFMWLDHTTITFANWLQYVSTFDEPPLVLSVSYGQMENMLTSGKMSAFQQWAILLGVRGITI
jgi:hypothetical protein